MTAAATLADPNLSRIYGPDGAVRDLEWVKAQNEVRMSGGRWSFTPPLPEGWDKEMPRYRATKDVSPATLPRHRNDPPYSVYDVKGECWQYGERNIKRGEEVETASWPHQSFVPLNHSARAVKEYFLLNLSPRMKLSPWSNGRVDLPTNLY